MQSSYVTVQCCTLMSVCQEMETRLRDNENVITAAKNLKQQLTEMLVSRRKINLGFLEEKKIDFRFL